MTVRGENANGEVAVPMRGRLTLFKVPLIVAAALIASLILGDVLIGQYEDHLVRDRQIKKAKLEKLAWYYLRADVDDVTYTADSTYRVKIWMENAFPEHDFYVMIPTVRVFIQVGPQWKEVPSRETAGARWPEGTVVHLTQRIETERIFDIQEKDYFELLPGYMHVRIDDVMYIAGEPEPKDDVAERADAYYIHLRPIGADDRKLRMLNNFPGAVPIFIPMPPH